MSILVKMIIIYLHLELIPKSIKLKVKLKQKSIYKISNNRVQKIFILKICY